MENVHTVCKTAGFVPVSGCCWRWLRHAGCRAKGFFPKAMPAGTPGQRQETCTCPRVALPPARTPVQPARTPLQQPPAPPVQLTHHYSPTARTHIATAWPSRLSAAGSHTATWKRMQRDLIKRQQPKYPRKQKHGRHLRVVAQSSSH